MSTFSAPLCGANVHIVQGPDAACPLHLAVMSANVSDIMAAKGMPLDAGAIDVFDVGYYDPAWWARLDAAGRRIVTRLKVNTPLNVVETLAVPAGAGNIVSDQVGFLPGRLGNGTGGSRPGTPG